MKKGGIVLIIVGIAWTLLAFSMNTTVETGGERIGSGRFAIDVPKKRVHNIGLMEERRNYLAIGGVMVVAGILLFGFGSLSTPAQRRRIQPMSSTSPAPSGEDTMSCPFCAETIRAAAKICRYCQRELPIETAPTASAPASAAAPQPEVLSGESFSRCRWCGAQVYATAESCDACFRPLRSGTGNPVATSEVSFVPASAPAPKLEGVEGHPLAKEKAQWTKGAQVTLGIMLVVGLGIILYVIVNAMLREDPKTMSPQAHTLWELSDTTERFVAGSGQWKSFWHFPNERDCRAGLNERNADLKRSQKAVTKYHLKCLPITEKP